MASDFSEATRRVLEPFVNCNIQSEEALRDALQEIVTLDSNTGAYHDLFRFLLSFSEDMPTKNILALLLSSAETGDILGNWLIDRLRADGEQFSTSNLAIDVFTYLSRTVTFLCFFERQVHLDLARYRAKVEHATIVIEALVRYLHTASASDDAGSEDSTSTEGFHVFVKTKQTQKQRKIAQSRPTNIFDEIIIKSCGNLKVVVPSNVAEARQALRTLVKELIDIFEYYLKLLHQPTVEEALRKAITKDPAEHHDKQPDSEEQRCEKSDKKLSPEGFSDEAREDFSAASLINQPMKAALYFESVDGFGEWRILISTRASLVLQDLRRRGKEAFIPVFKKIKKLSNGCFSVDNQKFLAEVSNGVPIYEAEMAKDLILVYQIDCAPEYEGPLEKQVIRVFGLYARVQIDKKLWESVSYQLGKTGWEYRTRCTYRNRSVARNGDEVVAPAYFPPLEAANKKEQISVPSFPTELLEEIHSLLVLEKYVTFSQAFLNSIIADLDVVHVFDVSPLEMEIIQHPNSCYVLGRSGTGKTTTMLFKMLGIQRSYEERKDVMVKPRQLFVTQSRVLAGKVEEYFSKLLDSLLTGKMTKEELAQMIKSRRQRQLDNGLIDVDDEQNWRADLPPRFSDLRDEHFPLFLTFDRLADLLEEDLRDSIDGQNLPLTTMPSSPATINNSRENGLITYEIFLSRYWPHISQNLKKGLDPALVYSELMGVIQGSEESLYHDSGYLSEASYKNLSHRTQTHRLLKAIHLQGVRGQKLDFLYVDEAQDNLLIDALLLRSLVKNPDGLFWAGDTAQTISVGSSFRFNDLKAFLYRFEQRHQQAGALTVLEPPRTFHLAVNYRSHGGIVDCAHSVIELITNFWPYAIDVLPREQGVVDGAKPVFYSGQDGRNTQYEQFFSSVGTGDSIEFGAQQCILVRNDAARDKLRQEVGEIGLILTLYESKGLEFDDVLLYKFFEDSTVDLSQWRVVLNMLENVSKATPGFDEVKHAGVCSELKFLYVAVTRARKNLWIVDNSDKGEPMRTFWSSRDEIQHFIPGTDVPRLAASSTQEEWAKVGKSLFSNKRYSQAKHCFDRAGMPREAAVATTYDLRDQARHIVLTGSKQSLVQRQEAFLAAARAFSDCAIASHNTKERNIYYLNAGACFEEANAEFEAAAAYQNGQEFTRAAKLYRKCGKFDEAVTVITSHRDDIDEVAAQNIIDIARLIYSRGGELEKAARLFDSVDEQLEYLEDFDLDVSRVALLEKLGKYSDAAGVHLAEGRTFEAIQLFLKDPENKAAVSRGQRCILQGLWEHIHYSLPQGVSVEAKEVGQLLRLASAIKSDAVQDEVMADEISMFKAIKQTDHAHLRTLARKFDAHGNPTCALLCFDFVFQTLPSMYQMPQSDISALLQDYLIFCKLLFNVTRRENFLQDDNIRRLFRIEASGDSEGKLNLPSGTFLHNLVLDSQKKVEVTDNGVRISEWDLAKRLKAHLDQRVVYVLKTEMDECKYAQAFSPCHSFVSSGGQSCHRHGCVQQHVSTVSLTPTWLILQIRIHLQQILLLDGLTKVEMSPSERMNHYRYWIGRLFNTLHPAINQLGNFANTDPSTIPEWPKAMAVLRTLFGNVFYHTGFKSSGPKLLTTGYQIIRIASYYDKAKAHNAVCYSPFADVTRRSHACVRLSGNPSTAILPEISFLLGGSHPLGITWGVLAVRHVIANEVIIEATTLWDLIDLVAGSVILLHHKGSFHSVHLPLSWLNQLLRVVKLDLKRPSQARATTSDLIASLVKDLLQLLERFITSNKQLGHLKLDSSDMSLLNTIPQRNIYISRLCRTLCLIGFNINNAHLKGQIHQALTRLKQITVHNLNLFKDYASAHHWGGLTRAVQRSIANSSLDEMIQLFHYSKVIDSRAPPQHVRRIVYNQVSDIPRLLDGSLQFSDLRADAPSFKPRPRAEGGPQATADDDTQQVPEAPAVDNSDFVNTIAVVEVSSVAAPNQDQTPSQNDIDAAIVCQRSFRQTQHNKAKKDMSSLQVSRQAIFLECLQFAQNHGFSKRSVYRLMYLGPLPHMLASLGVLHSAVKANKRRNALKLRIAQHLELDELSYRRTELNKVIDEIVKLQKKLAPASDFHSKADTKELRKCVLRVHTLVSYAEDVSEDMAIAYRGIVEPKKAPKPKAKPTLILDNVYNIDEDGANVHGRRVGIRQPL